MTGLPGTFDSRLWILGRRYNFPRLQVFLNSKLIYSIYIYIYIYIYKNQKPKTRCVGVKNKQKKHIKQKNTFSIVTNVSVVLQFCELLDKEFYL